VPERTPERTTDRSLAEGLAAGLFLGLADWIASGVLRTPFALGLASLGLGLAVGAGGGLVGRVSGRAGLASGLVVAAGIALEGLSLASKSGGPSALADGPALLVLGLALAALPTASGRPPSAARAAWIWLAVAAVPAASLAGALLGLGSWGRAALGAAPLAVLLLERSAARASRGPRLAAALSILLLAAPVAWAERERARPAPAPSPTSTMAGSARPSIVLLVIDTLRADAPAPDGALAELARGGVSFRTALAPAPWTLPSTASLLTALYPSQHGALSAATPLPEDVTTLAELLRAQGYATGAFTGGAFVGRAHRLDQGFEVFDSSAERRFAPFRLHTPLVWRLAKNRYLPLRFLVRLVDEYRGLAGVLEHALPFAEAHRGAPQFLFLHTYQVHDYYLYDPDSDDAVLEARAPPSAAFAGRMSVHPSELLGASQADLDHFHALYQGRVRAVEALVPELVRSLGAAVGEDALWIVTADHGEGFDAALGRVHHGGRLHDDLLHVPLILRAPGRLPPGTRVDAPVRTLDVLPTVLELAGIPVPAGLSGVSLLPALRGEASYPAEAFAEEREHGLALTALRLGDEKLLAGPGGELRYDVARDPGETHPLPGPVPQALRQAFDGFAQRFPARALETGDLDAATLQHLRELGYVE